MGTQIAQQELYEKDCNNESKDISAVYDQILIILNDDLIEHVPPKTANDALCDQWLHSLASDGDLFLKPGHSDQVTLKNRLIKKLTEAGFYHSKKQFYAFVFDGIEQKPNIVGRFKFIDLFAGIGGTRLGAQRNSGQCVFSSEFDSFAQDSYKLNYGETPFGDITTIDAASIPAHDLLLAGFPCQPFSYSGRCEGFEDKTRGTLFFDVLRILEEKQPKVVILENVKGFKSHDDGQTMHIALKALQEIGYHTKWQILNSYDFGVPQYRERWYCIATKENVNFDFPSSQGRDSSLRDIVDLENTDPALAINKFELSRIDYHFQNNVKQPRVEHDSSKYAPTTKKGRHGVYSFSKPDGSLRFHVGDVAKTQIQEAFYACLDTYSPTIIANRVPKLWDIKRKLSVEESLKLQGFPPSFKFNVSNGQAYKQLGNAVTVTVVENIVKQLLEQGVL